MDDTADPMRILFMTPVLPVPTTGERTLAHDLIKQLGARHEVHIPAFVQPAERALVPQIGPHCARLALVPFEGPRPLGKWRNRFRGLTCLRSAVGSPIGCRQLTTCPGSRGQMWSCCRIRSVRCTPSHRSKPSYRLTARRRAACQVPCGRYEEGRLRAPGSETSPCAVPDPFLQ